VKKAKVRRKTVISCDRNINPFTKYLWSVLLLGKNRNWKNGETGTPIIKRLSETLMIFRSE